MHRAILLVDDEPIVLAILHRVMAGLTDAYDLILLPDGAAALAQIAQRPVALVITDYQMPDMDGVVLTASIKARLPNCRVVLMTGHPTPELQHEAWLAGADFYLPKPFPVARLAGMIQAALAL
jgi:two-component system, response regulator, stage 0 sporulation protein F